MELLEQLHWQARRAALFLCTLLWLPITVQANSLPRSGQLTGAWAWCHNAGLVLAGCGIGCDTESRCWGHRTAHPVVPQVQTHREAWSAWGGNQVMTPEPGASPSNGTYSKGQQQSRQQGTVLTTGPGLRVSSLVYPCCQQTWGEED